MRPRFVLLAGLCFGCGAVPHVVTDAGTFPDAGAPFDAGLDAGTGSCSVSDAGFVSACQNGPGCACAGDGVPCACGFQCTADAMDYLRNQCTCGANGKLKCAYVPLPSGPCEGGAYCNVAAATCTVAGVAPGCRRSCSCLAASDGQGHYQCLDTCGAGPCPSSPPSGACGELSLQCKYDGTANPTSTLTHVSCGCGAGDAGSPVWSCQ